MNRDNILTETKNTEYIPGIYNYCDRWCERCVFTKRCMSYQLEQEEYADPETRDMDNQKFWEKISETFRITKELLYESAKEQGINLDEIDRSESDDLHDMSHEYAENHPLAKFARAYSKMVSVWFSEINHIFSLDYKEDDKSLIIIPTAQNNDVNIEEVEDAVSVIRWYQFQISVKLMRALNGVIMEKGDELWMDDEKDSDGSAKVSLIGIDYSIGAWGTLINNYPAEENSILDILVHLERLKKDIEKEFPDARKFIRPGFDNQQY